MYFEKFKSKRYAGKDIAVFFNAEIYAHAAKCVKGLPEVFDINKKPWVNANGAEADEIAKVIDQCPSGALKYVKKDSSK
ncbi:(4Fe-4S)-binding protein [Bacillus cereus]|uniref:(4Fe-4S)-binding protein n=1 Tax=Bacillus TaxID=1386 RepID=UPI0009DE964A|nr:MULTISPECIES: (4Fe-4S)-binding protein [unclassified Bacillus (in: firmicutes)]